MVVRNGRLRRNEGCQNGSSNSRGESWLTGKVLWRLLGVKISTDGSGLKECMESSSFQQIQVEAAKKLSRWDENIQCAEKVVYGVFLVSAAREAEVDW